jgi:alkaline phosphatase D
VSTGGPPGRTRREVIALGAGGAVLAGVGAVPGWARKRPPPLVRGGRFAEGVASGVPARGGMALWTRLSEVEGPARLQLEVARDEGFRRVVYRRRLTAVADNDLCADVVVPAARLRPGRRYWYRFETATEESPVGTFRTLPPRGSTDPVRIGFWTCQHFIAGHYAAHAALTEEPDLDLVVCLGDYIYEYGEAARIPGREDRIGANGDGNARTLDDYRAKYRLYRSDERLRELHRRHATAYLWDDHEVANNYWREGQNAAVHEGFAERRNAAYRAWFEHQPVRRMARSGPGASRIYHALPLGGLADLFFIDCRQYRDPQPCSDAPLSPCPTRNDPRTMLGAEQKAWLKEAMGRSRAPWKLLVNGLMMAGLDQPAPGFSKYLDTWDGYGAERQEIVSFWRSQEIRDVLVMTGDDHDNYAGAVTTTGHSDGEPGAVEFVVPSVTSDNTSELIGGSEQGADLSEQNTRDLNPHLALVDQRRHGYCVLELNGSEARVEFRHVADREDPQSPVATSYRLRVPRGEVALEAQ